jgi:hypothetical protein
VPGPQGVQGPPGADGQNKPKLLPWQRSGEKACLLGSCAVAVTCSDPQATVVSGGCGEITQTDALLIVSSGPSPDYKAWICQVVNTGSSFLTLASYEGYARCAK